MKIKQEKGIAGVDVATGIIIFAIASTTILTLYYQIYLHMAAIKVHEVAVAYITDIFEKIDLQEYDSVSTNTQIEDMLKSSGLPSSYQYEVNVTHYSQDNNLPEDQKATVEDIVERVNIKITYKLAGTQRSFEMSKIKIKE